MTGGAAPAPAVGGSVAAAIRAVLELGDPHAHVMATRALVRRWRKGALDWRFDVAMPDAPARPPAPELRRPGDMPRRGKLGSERGRIAMLHALAHIEYVAIALALDMAGRFGGQFPRTFVGDWLGVAADEAMHFALLDRRLRQLGSHYGALPAHDGLWSSATRTADDALMRLAVVPMLLEARGLDVTPGTVARFAAQGDSASAAILQRIYSDEIRHVSVGTRWFQARCGELQLDSPTHWKMLVKRGFSGTIQPPFNDSARESASLTQEYYAGVA